MQAIYIEYLVKAVEDESQLYFLCKILINSNFLIETNVLITLPSFVFHILIVLSHDPLAKCPFSRITNAQTSAECPISLIR